MAAQSNVNLRNLIDAATQWHRIFASDRTRAHLSPEFVSELEVFIGETRMIRWGLLATEEKVAEIWQSIMPGSMPLDDDELAPAQAAPAKINENIVDYVLNGAAYIDMVSDIATVHRASFISDLCHALCWPFKASYIDSDLKDRAADPSFLNKLFTDNPWILFLYVVSVSPLEFSVDPLVFGPTSSTGDKDT